MNCAIGDIIRYSSGPTALFRLESAVEGRLLGKHCMGGPWSFYPPTYSFSFAVNDPDDIKTFARCAHWRGEDIWPSHKPMIYWNGGHWAVQQRTPKGRYSEALNDRGRTLYQQAWQTACEMNRRLCDLHQLQHESQQSQC